MKRVKRGFSIFLAVVLAAGMLQVTAFAGETGVTAVPALETQSEDSAGAEADAAETGDTSVEEAGEAQTEDAAENSSPVNEEEALSEESGGSAEDTQDPGTQTSEAAQEEEEADGNDGEEPVSEEEETLQEPEEDPDTQDGTAAQEEESEDLQSSEEDAGRMPEAVEQEQDQDSPDEAQESTQEEKPAALEKETLQEGPLAEDVSETAANVEVTGLTVEYRSQDEIRAFFRNNPALFLGNTYEETPSAVSPYSAGKLSGETQESGINALNQARYIAGLNADITENESYTEMAQATALVNAANGQLSHYPEQPSGMEDALYNLGKNGAKSANIAYGADSVVESMHLWMSDSDSSNIDRVGHRRWILNPAMEQTGFGAVGAYSAVYALDGGIPYSSLTVAWPAQNMPVEYFNNTDAWSVSFGKTVTADEVSVTVIGEDGREWNFSSSSADGYFNVNNDYYGQQGCVIFRPEGISCSAGKHFEVTITGPEEETGTVQYSVDFFSICAGAHDYTEEVVKEATCTESGTICKYCQKCGQVEYEYPGALGHDYQVIESTDTLVTRRCDRCGDEVTCALPISFTPYWKDPADTGTSYYSSIPSGLEAGAKIACWISNIKVSDSVEADMQLNDFTMEEVDGRNCTIEKTDGRNFEITFPEAGTYHLKVYVTYNPNVYRTAVVKVVKPLESVTLSTSGGMTTYYGRTFQLAAAADGGKGTLYYSYIRIYDDGTEETFRAATKSATCTYNPSSIGTFRVRVDVQDEGDDNRIVSSNTLEILVNKANIMVKDRKKITAASTLTYGQKLSELEVNNAVFTPTLSSTPLTGEFVFDDPDAVLSAGTHTVGWTFTPASENYEPLPGTLSVTVNKAVPVVEKKPTAEAVYHSAKTLADIALTGGKADVEGSWEWIDTDTIPAVPGGTYACRFVPADERNYESVETEGTLTVEKAVPYIAKTSSGAIVYRQSLADSKITGTAQYSKDDTTAVSGTFIWADSSVKPSVSDSGKTKYGVIFTPDDADNYEETSGEAVLTVTKADSPDEMPPEKISVPYETDTVSAQILTDNAVTGWSFAESDAGKKLEVQNPLTLTLVYSGSDAGNYNTESVQVTLTRLACTHSGEKTTRNKKEATCREEGYTGDQYCKICGELVKSGTAIAKKDHSWDEGSITTAPTLEQEGVRTFTCKECGETRTEAIPKLINIGEAQILGLQTMTYTGSALKQTPTVKLGDTVLSPDTDYTVSFSNNVNAGTATVTVTGEGLYGGTAEGKFTIQKGTQSITAKCSVDVLSVGRTTTIVLTGNKGTKSFKSMDTSIATVTSDGKVTAKKVGTVQVKAIAGSTSNYNYAARTFTFKVVPAATASLTLVNYATGIRATWKQVAGANGYLVYRSGKVIATITKGTTLTYFDKTAVTNGQKYTYKIVAKASTGTSRLSTSKVIYRVARPAISSVTNSAAGKMTVKWGRNAKATGYQIQYSLSSSFASGNKLSSVTSGTTVAKVIGSLTKGKTYYVRMRTYINVGSARYYSAWSAAKTVKISQ